MKILPALVRLFCFLGMLYIFLSAFAFYAGKISILTLFAEFEDNVFYSLLLLTIGMFVYSDSKTAGPSDKLSTILFPAVFISILLVGNYLLH